MKCIKYSWDVVVAGAWNTAILTPDGIAMRVFNRSEDDVIEVDIPLNISAPPIVRFNNHSATATSERLTLAPTIPRYALMQESMNFAKAPLDDLKATPLNGVGINFRFFFDATSDKFSEYTNSSIDDILIDSGHEITDRRTRRSVKFGEGVANIDMFESASGEGAIMFNFHIGSFEHNKIKAWLGTPVAKFSDFIESLCDSLDAEIDKEELSHDNNAQQ